MGICHGKHNKLELGVSWDPCHRSKVREGGRAEGPTIPVNSCCRTNCDGDGIGLEAGRFRFNLYDER